MNHQPQVAFDPLNQFFVWWTQNASSLVFAPPPVPVTRFGCVSVLTLYRDREFQVQLAVCDPNSEITDHKHPGVELIKMYIGGQIYLRVNGEAVITEEKLKAAGGTMHGASMRIGPEDSHGALIGEMGGVFMTFQRHFGPVKSLGLCWDGPPLDARHERALEEWSKNQQPEPAVLQTA